MASSLFGALGSYSPDYEIEEMKRRQMALMNAYQGYGNKLGQQAGSAPEQEQDKTLLLLTEI